MRAMSARRGAVAIAILLAFATAGARADDGGDAVARAEREFGIVARGETLTALDAIADRNPASGAGQRARVWRAQLALVAGDLDGAERRFAIAARGPSAEQARFAHRGLG